MNVHRGILIAVVVAIVGSIIWWAVNQERTQLSLPELRQRFDQTREVITPPPLRGALNRPAGTLTADGILRETNRHREHNGVPAVHQHSALTKAAENKLQDMVAHQYFDHVGPDGKGPADWVEASGYRYIKVGENLALGNFKDDADVVQAWMDSPGHRANILNEDFTEIGIAAQLATFEGHRTWLAVQTFARPLADCPEPDRALEGRLTTQEQLVTSQGAQLHQERARLEALASQLKQDAAELQAKIDAGQAKIEQGNQKIAEGNRIYEETGDREQAEPYWREGERLQAEGRQLLQAADELRDRYNAAVRELQQAQQHYNEQVVILQQLQRELQQNLKLFNQQIRAFNACIS